MPGASKRSGDFTGIQAEKDKQAHAKELEARAKELSLLNEVQTNEEDTVVDLMGAQKENQTRKYLAEEMEEEGLVGFEEVNTKEVPGRPSKAKTTTLQPGQGVPGEGSLQNDGTFTYNGEIIKTNSTQVTGTGWETPSNSPGATGAANVTRARVDTLGDSINANPNNARRGLSYDEVEEVGGPVNNDDVPVEIRAKETIENMTFGVDNHYSFQEGRKYRVPKRVADHMEEKNLVWH